jgi:hypothetical protein
LSYKNFLFLIVGISAVLQLVLLGFRISAKLGFCFVLVWFGLVFFPSSSSYFGSASFDQLSSSFTPLSSRKKKEQQS